MTQNSISFYNRLGFSEKAYDFAVENRKFEIENYWRRTTYFWTIIGALFVAYFAAHEAKIVEAQCLTLSLGILLSFSWFLSNKASKFWQENWEHHVDALEDDICGPIYKTVLGKGVRQTLGMGGLTGAGAFSVSKINQLISLFVTFAWLALSIKFLFPENNTGEADLMKIVISILTVVGVLILWGLGRTNLRNATSLVYCENKQVGVLRSAKAKK